MLRQRRRRAFFPATAIAATLIVALLAARPIAERAVRARMASEASRRGLVLKVDQVRVALWPPLQLHGVVLEKPGLARLEIPAAEVWWAGRGRISVVSATLSAPAGLAVTAGPMTWDVLVLGRDHLRLALGRPQPGLIVDRTGASGVEISTVEAHDLPLGRLLEVRRSGRSLLDGGTMSGILRLEESDEGLRFDVDVQAHGARLPGLAGNDPPGESLGRPTDLVWRSSGAWKTTDRTLAVDAFSGAIDGGAVSGTLVLRDPGSDASLDLALRAERVDFAGLLRTAGIGPPDKLGAREDDDLGSAALAVAAQGHLSDPASFAVTQRLDFKPPARLPAAVERLRGDFVHEVTLESGAARSIDVAPSSPDFIPLRDVPPLFVRALLLAEDAGFYGHPGIDLREMPAAILTDIERGGAVRGASTITQQLAKNLFLSPEKVLGRKLQEVACALLLESALGKNRILEIYLNVIEWGPDLYGLRPAARVYFDREPRDLTPAQMAFLVSLIPGPVKYQVSFAHGTLGPGMRQLVDTLLAKLRSVDALTEEEYRKALAEEIVVRNVRPEPARTSLQ
jgi:hypothetical protein